MPMQHKGSPAMIAIDSPYITREYETERLVVLVHDVHVLAWRNQSWLEFRLILLLLLDLPLTKPFEFSC